MDFNLHCLNNNEFKNWKLNVYFELRCLSQTDGVENIVKEANYTFSHTNHTYHSMNFLSYNLVLENLRKNFVVDNTIYFQVYLKANELVRT